jgi:hypothetical protein
VFDAVSYRFFGRVADDGGFVLATALDIVLPPIPLPINGIRVVLPLQVSGRLRLEGQVTHRRRVASIVAEGRGRWDVVPGVVRVTAGDARPVRLRLNATGRFALDGEGAVDFFGGALRVDGALSASESHLMVSGTLRFAMGGTARNPAIGLEAAGALHVGPGDRWAFDGDGVLRLYDLRLVDVAVRLSDHEVAVHAALKRTRWRVGSLKVDTHLSGQLDGRIVFSDPAGKRPGAARLRLRGRGAFELLGARLAGSLAIDGDASGLRVEADGTLQWLQKTWIAARVAVDSAGSVEFAGRTSVVLDLTPSDLGIQVASLFLRADFAASFGFNARGAKISHTVDLDWSLGVRLPGGKPGQTFILAMQKLHIGAEQALDRELIHVQGMNFIPMSDVVIPIPVIKTSGSEQFIRARINIPIIDHVRFLMTDGLKDWLEDEFGEDFVKSRTKLFTVPKNFSVEVEDHSLGELAASFAFRVRVRWKDGMLGFEIRKGSERVFIGLDRLG